MSFDRPGFERAVGTLLQAARSKKGMTQEAVAEAIGVPRASYANLEAGRQRIPVDVIWRVAIILGISVVSLLPEPIYRPKVAEGYEKPSDDANTTSRNVATLLGSPLLSH
jgi:transcriptional regulator with XRE-family HTH domain